MSNTSTQEIPPMVDTMDAELDLLGVPDKPKGCELQEYVAERYARRLPLEFWKENDDPRRFPQLAKMARDYFAIPATSASSEHCFSQTRAHLPYTKNRLGQHKIKEQMLLESWFIFTENYTKNRSPFDHNKPRLAGLLLGWPHGVCQIMARCIKSYV